MMVYMDKNGVTQKTITSRYMLESSGLEYALQPTEPSQGP